MEIVTGSTGQVHVTSVDDAVRNGNVGYLNRNVVFTYLRNFEYLIVSNNSVRIYSGYGMMKGRLFKIDGGEFDDVVITNGAQGYKRADLIVAHYHMASQTGFESIELQVIRGNPGDSYVNPSYSNGDVNAGEDCDFPLYRVRLNGTTIEGIDRLFTLVADGGRLASLETTEAKIKASNLRTNLGSTSTAAMYNSTSNDVRPGVQGTLGVANGGTGQTTLKNAANSFAGSLDANNSTPNANDCYIGTTSGATGYQRKTLESLWAWLSTKIADRGYGDMLKKTFCGSDSGTVIQPSNGGTGQQSLQATRNAMGLGNTTGALPIANGGTGSTTAAGIRNAIGLGNSTGVLAADRGGTGQSSLQATRNAMGLGNTTGALPVANGGTGLTSSPSLLVNLGSTSAVGVMQSSPRPGVTGTLPIANGGTGATTAANARTKLGAASTSDIEGLSRAISDIEHTTAPLSHVSKVGSTSEIGHLKITDSPTSAHTASTGVAASGKTVRAVNDRIDQMATSIDSTYMKKSGGTFTGLVTVERHSEGLLVLGNETEVTNPNNQGSAGKLRIYNSHTYRANLVASEDMTDNRTLILPKLGGTLATTADIADKLADTESKILGNANASFTATKTFSDGIVCKRDSSSKAGGVLVGNYNYDGYVGIYSYKEHGGSTNNLARLRYVGDATGDANITFPQKSGTVQINTSSSRRVKENITNLSDDEARKILGIDVVKFDYISDDYGGKNECGVIAEDIKDAFPNVVEISKYYDEKAPIDSVKNPSPSVDYRKFVPYLIKMVQMQQKEIEELKAALNK